MLTVLGGLAEFERELIRARTGEGRERAKARGVQMGRKPKLTPHQTREAIGRRDKGETVRDIARTYNVRPQYDFKAPRSSPGDLQCNGQRGDALMPIRREYRWFYPDSRNLVRSPKAKRYDNIAILCEDVSAQLSPDDQRSTTGTDSSAAPSSRVDGRSPESRKRTIVARYVLRGRAQAGRAMETAIAQEAMKRAARTPPEDPSVSCRPANGAIRTFCPWLL